MDSDGISRLLHESIVARLERIIHRLIWVIVLLVVLLVGTNGAWLWYESQWQTVETLKVIQENEDGYNNYIGNDGDINNGKTDGNKD